MKSMPEEKDVYKKGCNPTLDRRYLQCKKINIFAHGAADKALSEKELDLLIKLWCKRRARSQQMKTQEISTLVDLYERVTAWRKNRKSEMSRIRNERRRNKLRDAAKNGDAGAVTKLQKKKKADRLYAQNYRKKKRALNCQQKKLK